MLERLQVCIINVTGVRNSLQQAQRNTVGEEGDTAAEYGQSMDELVIALEFLSVLWQQYIDYLHSCSGTDAYQVVAVRSGNRGRPRFDSSSTRVFVITLV